MYGTHFPQDITPLPFENKKESHDYLKRSEVRPRWHPGKRLEITRPHACTGVFSISHAYFWLEGEGERKRRQQQASKKQVVLYKVILESQFSLSR
eukprot:scaffold4071_cov136-Skeletonema_marinoi.AAC.5